MAARLTSAVALLAILAILLPISAHGETATSNAPTTCTSNSFLAGPRVWQSPANALIYDNATTTNAVDINSSASSNWLICTGFGFAIPSDATILGITITMRRYCSASGGSKCRDLNFRVIRNGVWGAGERAITGTAGNWPATGVPIAAAHGGPFDLWDETGWTPAEINASNFGAAVTVHTSGGANRTAFIDGFEVSVEFFVPTPTPGGPTATPTHTPTNTPTPVPPQPLAFSSFDIGSDNFGSTTGNVCLADFGKETNAASRVAESKCARTCSVFGTCSASNTQCLTNWLLCDQTSTGSCYTKDQCTVNHDCYPQWTTEALYKPPGHGANPFAAKLRSNPYLGTTPGIGIAAPIIFDFGKPVLDGIVCLDLAPYGTCANAPYLRCGGVAGPCAPAHGACNTTGPLRNIELLAADGTPQCLVELNKVEAVTAVRGETWRADMFFNDPLQRKCGESWADNSNCVGNAEHEETPCIPALEECHPLDGECPSEPNGRPVCGYSHYARSPFLTLGEYNKICVQWHYVGKEVECGLFTGVITANETESHVRSAGRRSVWQGTCDGGPSGGFACGVDEDCEGGACCSGDQVGCEELNLVTVAPPTQLRVGLLNADDLPAHGVVHMAVDNVVVYELDVVPDYALRAPHQRWLTLIPNGAGGLTCGSRNTPQGHTGCSSAPAVDWGCVDDSASGTCDGSTTYIGCGATEKSAWSLTDVPVDINDCATNDSGPCIRNDGPVIATCAGRQSTASTESKLATTFFRLGGVNDAGTSTEVGSQTSWHPTYSTFQPHVKRVDPNGAAWTVEKINNLNMGFANDAPFTSGRIIRTTSCVTNVPYELPPAKIPRVLADQNNDGKTTACLLADSLQNGGGLHAQWVQRLFGSVDNVIECAEGGRICSEMLDNIECAADGNCATACGANENCFNPPNGFKCNLLLGDWAKCDVLFVGGCSNDYLWSYGQTGSCSTGGSCTVPAGRVGTTYDAWPVPLPASGFFCVAGPVEDEPCGRECARNSGSGAICLDSDATANDCACAGATHIDCNDGSDLVLRRQICMRADCGRCNNAPTRQCNIDAHCQVPSGGACVNATGTPDRCDLGKANWCWQFPTWNVPSCPNAWCGESTQMAYTKGLWQQMADALAARVGTDAVKVVWMPPTKIPPDVGPGWNCQHEQLAAQGNWAKPWAAARGEALVDFRQHFWTISGGNPLAAIQANDLAHWSSAYQVHGSDLMADCLLGIPGAHTCTNLYTPCTITANCAGQAHTTCQDWPGTSDKYCLGDF